MFRPSSTLIELLEAASLDIDPEDEAAFRACLDAKGLPVGPKDLAEEISYTVRGLFVCLIDRQLFYGRRDVQLSTRGKFLSDVGLQLADHLGCDHEGKPKQVQALLVQLHSELVAIVGDFLTNDPTGVELVKDDDGLRLMIDEEHAAKRTKLINLDAIPADRWEVSDSPPLPATE